MKNKQIVLSGFFGYGSMGDEAILYSVIQQLKKEEIEPIVLSGNPEKTTNQYGVKTIHRLDFSSLNEAIKQCDGFLFIEGNGLKDSTSLKTFLYYLSMIKLAQINEKPTFFYSQQLSLTKHRFFFPFLKSVLKKCTSLLSSNPSSQAFIEQLKIARSFELVTDPIFEIETEKKLLLPLSLETFLEKEPILFLFHPSKIDELKVRVEECIKQDIPVLFFSSHYVKELDIWSENELFHVHEGELTLDEIFYVFSHVRSILGTSIFEVEKAVKKDSLIHTINHLLEVKKND